MNSNSSPCVQEEASEAVTSACRAAATILEGEGRRIGREMHDGLSQQLAAMTMMAEALVGRLAAENSTHLEIATQLLAALKDTKHQARDLCKLVLPTTVNSAALPETLSELARYLQRSRNIPCEFECAGAPPEMDSFAATQLYHVARDSLFLFHRAGRASRISIVLSQDHEVFLAVTGHYAAMDWSPSSYEDELMALRGRASLIGGRLSIQQASPEDLVVECRFEANTAVCGGHTFPKTT
jgi:signal transduction histidine kinase